ncbi:hypothetical protein [Tsukamurella sp. PLM1]|uniref:hypothetical protein n=1 Tax=Tsukamurella sp. PLM1 TaxID=2929795 RepID=UPI00206F699B|nr:hypothetical protein [Tsukamurella sp. PLM1]BDH55439.1 hypothetical protein MTP03_03780 [Tsukamurella sp. PLM1]
MDRVFAELESSTRDQLVRDGVDPADTVIERSVDVRYRSQTHELIVPVAPGTVDADVVRQVVDRFEAAYEDTYGKGAGFREAGIELTTFRVSGIGRTPKPTFRDTTATRSHAPHVRKVYDLAAGGWMDATVVDWFSLAPGEQIAGPAVVEHPTTTVYTGFGQRVGVDVFGNLIITA